MHGSFAAEKIRTAFSRHHLSLSPPFNTQRLLSPILSLSPPPPPPLISLFVLLDISSNKKKISFLHPSEITG